MGMMKAFLMEKITEFAQLTGWTEKEIYNNEERYALALRFADRKLKRLLNESK